MSNTFESFSEDTFHNLCDILADRDTELQSILDLYGYPPMWTRDNSYETLVHIILEQQVSLASAKAALEKLRMRIGHVTPENLLALSDEELKACYFSRQKTVYARSLAQALISGDLDLAKLTGLPSATVRAQLISTKGIGNWTVDIYLIMVLHRSDVFPIGDLAAITALKRIKQLPKDTPLTTLEDFIGQWKPYRTIATMLLWHYYLSSRSKA